MSVLIPALLGWFQQHAGLSPWQSLQSLCRLRLASYCDQWLGNQTMPLSENLHQPEAQGWLGNGPARMMHVMTGVSSRERASPSTPPTDRVSPSLANSRTNCNHKCSVSMQTRPLKVLTVPIGRNTKAPSLLTLACRALRGRLPHVLQQLVHRLTGEASDFCCSAVKWP